MHVLRCHRVVVFSAAAAGPLGNKSFYSFHILNAWNIPGKGSASGPEKIQLISCDFKDVDITFQEKPKSHGERLGLARLDRFMEIERVFLPHQVDRSSVMTTVYRHLDSGQDVMTMCGFSPQASLVIPTPC